MKSRAVRWTRWLEKFSHNNGALELVDPKIVAYYWDGSAPKPHRVLEVTRKGAFLETEERWYIGTIVKVVLQLEHGGRDNKSGGPTSAISVPCKVVAHLADGVLFEFMFMQTNARKELEGFLRLATEEQSAKTSLRAAGGAEGGQALVELALLIPLLFVLIINIVNFGGFLFGWITVANAARVGAQYMVATGTSYVGSPVAPTGPQINTVINADMFSLLKGTSPTTVNICANNNGTLTTYAGTCSTATTPADPEAPSYTLGTVDVTYTYKSLIPIFDFVKLGIHAASPGGGTTATIHRQAVMRFAP